MGTGRWRGRQREAAGTRSTPSTTPCPESCLCPSGPAGPRVPPLGGGSPPSHPAPPESCIGSSCRAWTPSQAGPVGFFLSSAVK